MKLTENTIFITGGGTGIGRGLGEALRKLGNKVIISGRRKEHLDATTKANPGMHSVELDIADPANIAVETEGHLAVATGRSAHEHLNGAHRLGVFRRVAPEVDPVFAGHNGLGGGSRIVLRPSYRVKLAARVKRLAKRRIAARRMRRDSSARR